MITYKTDREIEFMKEGGIILQKTMEKLEKALAIGVKTIDLDKLAEEYILSAGAEPSFKKVLGYKYTTCICIGEQVVHTPPGETMIQDGDVVTIDCGVFFEGMHTDSATTVQVGKKDSATSKFLEVGKQTLEIALSKVKLGNKISDISAAIEKNLREHNLFVIYELTGHGVGRQLHEDPSIPGFVTGNRISSPQIKKGMTLAVEIIYSKGTHKTLSERGSDWSLVTADGSLSACFERTVAVLQNGSVILA